MNHLDYVPKPGMFPLIVDPLVITTQLTKPLMDGGGCLNLMYLDTFEGLGLGGDLLKTSLHRFYRGVSSKQSAPLRQISLPVTFRDASNYRTEMLTFEVVNFSGPYHAILGRPCYIKFIVISSCAYLKLKISGPTGTITVDAKAQ
jgi:hypothetical protein